MTNPDAHLGAVEAWRAQRYAALCRDVGWLTLAGLHWLTPGDTRIGSDPGADIVLSGGPAHAGTITLPAGQTHAAGEFTHDGDPVRDLPLVNDQHGEPTMLELGALRLCVIERGGRLALRTWDLDAAARRDFDGIDHWPVSAAWSMDGRFAPTPGRTLPVPHVLGTNDEQESPGDVRFELDGVPHRLQALKGGDSGAQPRSGHGAR